MPFLTLCLPPARWGPKAPDSECNGNIAKFSKDFFQFNQNATIYTDLIVIRHLMPKLTFVSHLLAEDPGPSIPIVVAILPDFDGFLQITSKLDYLYRFSRNLTPTMPVLTLCLPPARWGPKAPDSECSGQYCQISMDFFKSSQNSTIYTDWAVIRHLQCPVLTFCLPPARWGPKAPDLECNGNIASFRRISSI